VYPGDPPVQVERLAEMDSGSAFRLRRYTVTGHVGTHVDAPAHVIEDGLTVDRLPLELFVGEAWVAVVPTGGPVAAGALDTGALRGTSRLLIRTWTGEGATLPTRAHLAPEAAERIVEAGVRLVGIDSFSVDPLEGETLEAHRILLGAGIPILEGLDLRRVAEGLYLLVAAPVRVEDGDGAPVRAFLGSLSVGEGRD